VSGVIYSRLGNISLNCCRLSVERVETDVTGTEIEGRGTAGARMGAVMNELTEDEVIVSSDAWTIVEEDVKADDVAADTVGLVTADTEVEDRVLALAVVLLASRK
jgi:hypothetical protein